VTDTPTPTTGGREAIGLFCGREDFETCVRTLIAAGFKRTDLSVLASHESIDAAGKPGEKWSDVMTALLGEIRFEAPLVASGAIFLAGGPVAATVAGLIGAATGAIAVKEVIEGVTSTPHTDDFARSLAAGSVILWVRAGDAEREAEALRILEENGASNVHIHDGAA